MTLGLFYGLTITKMSVQSKTISSVFLFLILLFLVPHDGVDAFHVDKPMIYINFFDEVVTDNASSKSIDKGLTTTSTPSNNSATDPIRKKIDLSAELLKLNDDNKTSAPVPYDSPFEFDMPSKADITEISVNESGVDPSTTEFSDLIDPEFLEPEITRMFFLRAIANLIEHIMMTLFAIDDTAKLNESPGFDYDLAPSRNLRKRDLPSEEGTTKLSDASQSVEHKTESKISLGSVNPSSEMVALSNADLITEKRNTEQTVSSSSTHEPEVLTVKVQFVENIPVHSSHTPSTVLVSGNVSPYHSSHKATVTKSHSSNKENEAKSILAVKSEQDPDGKVKHGGKFIGYKNSVKPAPVDEMFHFSEESSLLNDEVINKKDTHFYEGIHPAEDSDESAENFADKEDDDDNSRSSFIVTVFLVGTTALILMLLGALALAAGYLFRKSQESENQNATNLRSAVA